MQAGAKKAKRQESMKIGSDSINNLFCKKATSEPIQPHPEELSSNFQNGEYWR